MMIKIMMWLRRIRAMLDALRKPERPDPLLLLLEHMVKSQEARDVMMADAMKGVIQASVKQADVLNSYLSLFKGQEAPERWTRSEVEQNKQEMAEQGFPIEGTETEQAEWVLKHM